jgi:hypothetical protein
MESQSCESNLQGELELNLRNKTRKHLVRAKPEVLTVTQGISQARSMDFMLEQLQVSMIF